MKIVITSVLVDDQEKALRFYTEKLGFVKKTDIPMGPSRWLTVVSPGDVDGVELLLEPDHHPAAGPFKRALVEDGIPFTSFGVDDVQAEFERLRGVKGSERQVAIRDGRSTDEVLQPIPYAAGKVGQAFLLDGSGDYVSCPDIRPASFTLEGWFLRNSGGGPLQILIAKQYGSSYFNSFAVYVQDDLLRAADGHPGNRKQQRGLAVAERQVEPTA